MDQSIWYMQQVIAWQPRLYAFILSLTGDPNAGDDVLQNANVAILQKQKAFRRDAKFGAWVMQIAYHEVQRHWDCDARARRRFDNRLLDQLAAKMGEFGDEPGLELVYLRQCMSRLSAQSAKCSVFATAATRCRRSRNAAAAPQARSPRPSIGFARSWRSASRRPSTRSVAMTPDQEHHGELQALLSAMFDGQMTAAEQTRLADLLRDDTEAQQTYLDFCWTHALLRRELGAYGEVASRGLDDERWTAETQEGSGFRVQGSDAENRQSNNSSHHSWICPPLSTLHCSLCTHPSAAFSSRTWLGPCFWGLV